MIEKWYLDIQIPSVRGIDLNKLLTMSNGKSSKLKRNTLDASAGLNSVRHHPTIIYCIFNIMLAGHRQPQNVTGNPLSLRTNGSANSSSMRRNLLFTILALTFTGNLFAQNFLVKQWDKRFGGTDFDYFHSFIQTADGGYILGGASRSGIGGDKTQPTWGINDYWIIKTDSLGNKLWDKNFGGTNYDDLYSIQQTTDLGYILGGWSASGVSGDKTQPCWGFSDYWIVKTDSLGNKLWDKNFGGTLYDFLICVQQTSDGGYILGGRSTSGISGDRTQPSQGLGDYWIVKTDSLGNKIWDKAFGGTNDDVFYSLDLTSDAGFIFGGYSFSDIGGDKSQDNWDTTNATPDYWIVKTDSLGNKEWDKRFGGTAWDHFFSLQQTSDDGYILGGGVASGISGDKTQPNWDTVPQITYDYWIIKTNSLGIKQWDKRFGGTDHDLLYTIQQTSDQGYLLSGLSESPLSGDKTENNLFLNEAWIVKTDSSGNKQWDKTVFTTGYEESGLAIETTDGCFTIANVTNGGIGGHKTQPNWDTTNGTTDFWSIKFCDTTTTSSIHQITDQKTSISIYPNPTSSKLRFFLNKIENIIITNIIGEYLLTTIGKGNIELDVSFLSAGIYFIKIGNETRKFVKK
jgi:hypothetical protein